MDQCAAAGDALKVEADRRADDPTRLSGVESLGVDEHIWRPRKFGAGREVTCMVDLTRDANGHVTARLLDLAGRPPRRRARHPGRPASLVWEFRVRPLGLLALLYAALGAAYGAYGAYGALSLRAEPAGAVPRPVKARV